MNLTVPSGSDRDIFISDFKVICSLIFIFAGIAWNPALFAQQNRYVLDPELHHIRSEEEREWSIYPETTDRKRLIVTFDGTENMSKATLKFQQYDVKQRWTITLNDLMLGNLHMSESDITGYFTIPAKGI